MKYMSCSYSTTYLCPFEQVSTLSTAQINDCQPLIIGEIGSDGIDVSLN